MDYLIFWVLGAVGVTLEITLAWLFMLVVVKGRINREHYDASWNNRRITDACFKNGRLNVSKKRV